METIYEIQRIKQVVTSVEVKRSIIRQIPDAADLAIDLIGDEDREVFLVACLNVKMEIVAVHRAHIGSLCATTVHPM